MKMGRGEKTYQGQLQRIVFVIFSKKSIMQIKFCILQIQLCHLPRNFLKHHLMRDSWSSLLWGRSKYILPFSVYEQCCWSSQVF